jgi:chitinase
VRRTLAALTGAALAVLALAAGATSAPPPAHVVAAYFAAYDSGFNAADIPADRLTDVIYAFGAIDAHGQCTLGDPYADVRERFPGSPPAPGGLHGNFGQLALLQARHPALATEISIGGWSGSRRFSAAAATATGRRALVASCIDLFLRGRPGLFGGIDVDWEFPVAGGAAGTPARAADRADATALFAEFRRQLDVLGAATHRHYLLTAAMPAFRTPDGGYTPSRSYDLPAVARLLDWINLMTYDMTTLGVWRTDFESALHPTAGDPRAAAPGGGNTVDGAVRFYEAAGVPASQIVIGAPFYGHVFTHVQRTDGGLFQRFRALGPTPSYGQLEAGFLPGAVRHWSVSAQEPWLYSHAARSFVSYDDPAAMAAKAQYVLAGHLRGAMVWEISMDDAAHSLLNALSAPLMAPAAN